MDVEKEGKESSEEWGDLQMQEQRSMLRKVGRELRGAGVLGKCEKHGPSV